jgi:DNA-binding NtrC family response regulator
LLPEGAGMSSTTDTIDKPARILVEDNEAGVREGIASTLTTAGYECRVSETPMETSKILESGENIDLVLCGTAEWTEEDLKRIIVSDSPWNVVPVVISTGDVGLMAKVLQMGAYDILLRPFRQEQLIFAVRRALEHRRLKIETLFLRNRLGLGSGISFSLSFLVKEHRKSMNLK